MVITFCGHSNFIKREEVEQRLFFIFREQIGDCPAELYLGGYGSFDEFAYDCGKKYQSAHQNISLIFVTPYMNLAYQEHYLEYQKNRYDDILYPEIEFCPPKYAISHRNRYMVDRADFVIAYIDHAWGGAYQTYLYAKRKSKTILNLAEGEFS